MSDRKRADRLWDWHKAQLREVDYWIAMSEKIGMERLSHKGMPDGRKTEFCKTCFDVADYDEVIQQATDIMNYYVVDNPH